MSTPGSKYNKQGTGSLFRWRGEVADATARDAISVPLVNDYCVQLDDAVNNIVYVYNGTEWNKTDKDGGIVGAFKKNKIYIQEHQINFLVSVATSNQFLATGGIEYVNDDKNMDFAGYISAIPQGITTDTKDLIRITVW